jgi:hypothetical protein
MMRGNWMMKIPKAGHKGYRMTLRSMGVVLRRRRNAKQKTAQ